jgi:lipopolysaccharide cholinephosphotransferase
MMVKLNIELPPSFFEPEERNGFLITKERKEIWAVGLDLLNELDRVCKKHGLQYFVDSGSLIGAVRHKGFIPWDDDIDVIMKRADYDKLSEIAATEFKHPYFLQTAYSDKGYLRGHAQLRNSDTSAMLPKESKKVPFNQGIFLDIFPIDVDSKIKFFNRAKCWILRKYHIVFSYVYMNEPGKSIKSKIYAKIAEGIRKDPEKANRHFENICRFVIFKSSCYDKVSYYRRYNKYKYFEDELFSKVLYVPFENLTVPIPVGYDVTLSRTYGKDYMVPKNIPNCHEKNGALIVSTSESYKEILKRM